MSSTEANVVGDVVAGAHVGVVVALLSIREARRVVAPALPSVTLPEPAFSVSDWPPTDVPSTDATLIAPLAALVSKVTSSASVSAPKAMLFAS